MTSLVDTGCFDLTHKQRIAGLGCVCLCCIAHCHFPITNTGSLCLRAPASFSCSFPPSFCRSSWSGPFPSLQSVTCSPTSSWSLPAASWSAHSPANVSCLYSSPLHPHSTSLCTLQVGVKEQFKHMFEKKRLFYTVLWSTPCRIVPYSGPFSVSFAVHVNLVQVIYAGTLTLTMACVFSHQSIFLIVPLFAAQFLSLIMYIVSYMPGGISFINFIRKWVFRWG